MLYMRYALKQNLTNSRVQQTYFVLPVLNAKKGISLKFEPTLILKIKPTLRQSHIAKHLYQ